MACSLFLWPQASQEGPLPVCAPRPRMGDIPPPNRSSTIDVEHVTSPRRKRVSPKLSVLPLVFLIFYEVSGGPFGIEDAVRAGGPLLAILGFVVFPIIWSIPEALITAEMGTMFPENGGYVVWLSEAFGPFWGFQQGWWKWLSGVIDNALYPVLFLEYFKFVVPAVTSGPVRNVTVLVITAALTFLNYKGLTIVGWMALGLGVFSLLPFVVMALLAIPHLDPGRGLQIDMASVDWNTYFNTLFWNLNSWDSVSTLVGEVESPHQSLPRALFFAVVLVVSGYMVPLLAGVGSFDVERSKWHAGYFANIAISVGGSWLGWWMEASAALSNMGMFEAEMSSDSFQLLGMAERGMLPSLFAKRSTHGTPSWGILASATGVLLLSWMSFQEIIAAENYLYCFGMLGEFAAFIWLRVGQPDRPRPYKIPCGTIGAFLLCLPSIVVLFLVMVFATWKVIIVSFVSALIGFAIYPCLELAKGKKWIEFSVNPEVLNTSDDLAMTAAEAKIALLQDEKIRVPSGSIHV